MDRQEVKAGSRTGNAISEVKEERGGWQVPVPEDCLGLVVAESTTEVSTPKIQNWRAEWGNSSRPTWMDDDT
jgi:hypothetical protein